MLFIIRRLTNPHENEFTRLKITECKSKQIKNHSSPSRSRPGSPNTSSPLPLLSLVIVFSFVACFYLNFKVYHFHWPSHSYGHYHSTTLLHNLTTSILTLASAAANLLSMQLLQSLQLLAITQTMLTNGSWLVKRRGTRGAQPSRCSMVKMRDVLHTE